MRKPVSKSSETLLKGTRRTRKAVLRDFEKISGPLRGQNQDRKPKA